MPILFISELHGSKAIPSRGLDWRAVGRVGETALSFSEGNAQMFKSLNKFIQRFMGSMALWSFPKERQVPPGRQVASFGLIPGHWSNKRYLVDQPCALPVLCLPLPPII